ncbi:family 43 glycosylhydrolase [Halobacteria archaeon AArc-m2/3/4]|uniref:Family 43 glycosylhydrolase n=1 Tax=Natronoglomus mannanivorans TaxID=2979990 RepID=A0AAP2YXZ4_9EURY|nr:family 43 glycosylhydrolase [Halobacteria archaeon AArc-xg1-1]MCU4972490.1 family 43 glycosylhydrolase [Halobacteria archaeon AArc-m2/3/4]
MTAQNQFGAIERRSLLKAIGAGAIGATGVIGSSATTAATNHDQTYYENPLYGPDFADPTIHRADDGTWWAYASNMSYSQNSDEDLVPILSSQNLVDWTYEGEAFTARPGWLYGSVWAPDVHYYDGQWVLFYALWPREDDDDLVPGIGVATSETPAGPFTDHGEILSNPDHPYPGNTIDPYFVEHEGTLYLFWANFAGVYVVELTEDLQDFRSETFQQIAGYAYEGPTIFHRDGYWYFFGATGDCCDGFDSTYEVEVGRSENLLGPYHDRDGTPMLERDEWNAGPTHLGDDERFIGPGHGDVAVDDDGSYWFLYHAYDTDGPETADVYGWPPARQLFIDRVYWTADGWPIIGGDETPSMSAPVPNLGQHPAPVDDGTYRIVSVDGRVLTVDGTDEGASALAITATTADESRAQAEWQVSRLSGGEYVLENAASGHVLEVENADTSDGADVQQWPWHRHPTQRWYLHGGSNGTYHLENACSAKFASAENESTANGMNVIQSSWNGGDGQRWTFEAVDDGDGPPPIGDNANAPTDITGDGRYEDVNGNGTRDVADVVDFFENLESPAIQDNVEAFDFSDNGRVGTSDVVRLFENL